MTRTTTKHQLILESLEGRIRAGEFQPGDRLPSDSQLVREFGASRPTVARAVTELERSGLVRRRRGSGTYVQDRPSVGKMFGLLIPGLGSTEIFEPICAEIARFAQGHKHSLIWGGMQGRVAHGDDRAELALDLCRQYVAQQVSGVFFAPLELARNKDAINREIIKSLRGAGIPVVLLDRDYLAYPERSDFDLVGIDNRRAGFAIAHHLIEQGCTRVMFLARPASASTIDERIAGFLEAVRRANVRTHSPAVQCDPEDRDYVRHLLAQHHPDGIVCGNDATAARLMHSLDALGVSVPAQVLVAGIDDVRYAELLRVPLTTMHQPCEAIGRAAFRAMLERIEDPDQPPRDILLKCRLVPRESTRPTGKA